MPRPEDTSPVASPAGGIRIRRRRLVAGAIATVLLLAACTSPGSPGNPGTASRTGAPTTNTTTTDTTTSNSSSGTSPAGTVLPPASTDSPTGGTTSTSTDTSTSTLTTTTTPAPTSTGATPTGGTAPPVSADPKAWVVSPGRVGPLEVGANASAYVAPGWMVEQPDSEREQACYVGYLMTPEAGQVALALPDSSTGVIFEIWANPPLRTARGITIGSRVASLRTAYGAELVDRGVFFEGAWHEWVVLDNAGRYILFVAFENGSTITNIHVGAGLKRADLPAQAKDPLFSSDAC